MGGDRSDPGNTVRCHSDLTTCCSSDEGDHRGELYFPDGNPLGNAYGSGDIYKRRGDQVIHLRRRNDVTSPSGIYYCEIPTIAVNDDVDAITGETVYVGLYPPNEGIYIYCDNYREKSHLLLVSSYEENCSQRKLSLCLERISQKIHD